MLKVDNSRIKKTLNQIGTYHRYKIDWHINGFHLAHIRMNFMSILHRKPHAKHITAHTPFLSFSHQMYFAHKCLWILIIIQNLCVFTQNFLMSYILVYSHPNTLNLSSNSINLFNTVICHKNSVHLNCIDLD